MSWFFRGKPGGALVFLLVAGLVFGGLGWVTSAVLSLETQQQEATAKADLQSQLQLALSLLDGRIRPALAKEDARPYNHYSVLYAPSVTLDNRGNPLRPGKVLAPSPLLNAELPEWMLLHFQVEEESGWTSPQVLSDTIQEKLKAPALQRVLVNNTAERAALLRQLDASMPPWRLLEIVPEHVARPSMRDSILVPSATEGEGGPRQGQAQGNNVDPIYQKRVDTGSKVANEGKTQQKDDSNVANTNIGRGGLDWLYRSEPNPPGEQVAVVLSSMVPMWLRTDDDKQRLLFVRMVRVCDRQVCQGIVLDADRLQALLLDEVDDLFPDARIVPMREPAGASPDRTLQAMTALPFQVDPGPDAGKATPLGWTTLRAGLVLSWVAALVALGAVALGGLSLFDLSERRIRFVSAVTHELRTPLTTLRLYLDMLTGGMVREEKQREEYLQTLHGETERLHRLVGNVLDFSRLERQRPNLVKKSVKLTNVLEALEATCGSRCAGAGKQLVLEDGAGEAVLETDVEVLQQVIGNLVENAIKYSAAAEDNRIWLRARAEKGKAVLEVEDCGPGVPYRERRAIFRPFRRGREVHASAGGVGLGLALSLSWAQLLGGRLSLCGTREGTGACFRLELPAMA